MFASTPPHCFSTFMERPKHLLTGTCAHSSCVSQQEDIQEREAALNELCKQLEVDAAQLDLDG